VNTLIGDTVRHSLEALGPVTICDGQDHLVFANRSLLTLRGWDENLIRRSVWAACVPATRQQVEPHWVNDPADQVLYLPDAQALNADGTTVRTSSVGMWMPYNDGVNVGRVRVSAAMNLSEHPTERGLRNMLGIAVQAVQLGQLRMAYDETAQVARVARQVLADIRVRLCHAVNGLDGNPEEELYELRHLVADLSVILQHPLVPAEVPSSDG
jgi:hypothetical protein